LFRTVFIMFKKTSVGLDIADSTIEVVELIKTGGKVSVLGKGRVLLDPGIVERGRIKDKEKLAEAVKKAFSEARPFAIANKKLTFALPENQVYIHTFHLEAFEEGEIDDLVEREAQENVPLKKDDLLFSYKILLQEEDRTEVLLVAASKEVVEEWQSFFQGLGLSVQAFDIESLAIFRGLLVKASDLPVCVVDIGSATTLISIFDHHGLCYSHSLNIAGMRFSEQIASALKIEFKEAEEQKIKSGVAKKGSKIFWILVKELETLGREIKTLLDYFQKKSRQKITKIILVGGSSRMKGIKSYFNVNLGLPVEIGGSGLLKRGVELEYIGAAGSSLRLLEEEWDRKDPVIFIKSPSFADSVWRGRGKRNKREKREQSSFEVLPEEDPEQSFFSSLYKGDRTDKLRAKKIVLISILCVGAALVALTYAFRVREKARRDQELESQIVQYTKTQSFTLGVLIATSPEQYGIDRAEGRIVEDIVEEVRSYRETIVRSKARVEKSLEKGEELWMNPINEPADVGEVSFPLTIRWLVYPKEGVNNLFLKEIDKINEQGVDYLLSKIGKTSIVPGQDTGLFYLEGKVTISLNQLIEGANQESGDN